MLRRPLLTELDLGTLNWKLSTRSSPPSFNNTLGRNFVSL
jgi:hypothetical protein